MQLQGNLADRVAKASKGMELPEQLDEVMVGTRLGPLVGCVRWEHEGKEEMWKCQSRNEVSKVGRVKF